MRILKSKIQKRQNSTWVFVGFFLFIQNIGVHEVPPQRQLKQEIQKNEIKKMSIFCINSKYWIT